MKFQTISLCMIVKDEERTLERCLESVKGIVDEIVIVDTGSTDRTVEIASQYTTKIFSFEWNDDFSDARNFAAQFATGDYILTLDADEYLDSASKHLLLEPLTADYYFLRIRNIIRNGIVDTHSFIRMYSRFKGFIYQGAIHEQINFTDFPKTSPGALSVYIIHDGYEKSIIENKNKHGRNMRIIEEELRRKPTAFGYFNLGNQYKSIGEMDKAVIAYSTSYGLDPNMSFGPKLIVYLTQSLMSLKRYDESLRILGDFIQLHPTYTDLYYEQGVLYTEIEYFKDAEAAFLKCLELGDVTSHLYSSMEGVGSYLAHAQLAEMYMKWNNYESAREHIFQSLTQNKMHAASLRILLESYINLNPKDTLEKLASIYTLESVEEASLLLQVLYLLRNPAFTIISASFKQDLNDAMTAWTYQVEGEYERAKQLLLKNKRVIDGTHRDILYLAVVTRDTYFFNKFKHEFSICNKDKGILLKIINREGVHEAEVSPQLNSLVEDLFYDLLMLRQYEVIEYFMNHVNATMIRYELARMLYKFQFTELSLQALTDSEESTDKAKVYELAGDILNQMEMYGDAYQYYNQYLKLSSSYEFAVVYKIHELSLKVGDENVQKDALKRMKEMVPRSEWAGSL